MLLSRRALVVVLVLLVALAACGTEDERVGTSTTTGIGRVPLTTMAFRTVPVGAGLTRDYSVYVPKAAERVPLVVVLDSLGGTTDSRRTPPRLVVEAAVGAGFAVAVPTGSEGTWNAGDCCGQALLEGVDDVAFLDAVLADAAESLPIDPDRVIVAGFSNGGMMAYRYACQRAGRLAGVMVVEGVLAASPCRPAAPIDLLQIHQLGDANVPFAGTDSASFSRDGTLPGVVASFETWSRAQRCGAAEVRRDGEIESRTARCRGARARLLVVDGGSHAWPTDPGTVDATQVLIDFFGLAPAS